MSSTGAIEWQKVYGGSAFDAGNCAIELPGDGYMLLGSTGSSDGDVSGNHSLMLDLWLAKINDTGAIQWQKCIGGSSDEIAYGMIKVNDGYIISAVTKSNDGMVSGNHGNADYWLLKVNDTGKILWQKCAGGSGDDMATSMVATYDSGYVMAGYTFSNNGDVSGNHGNTDMWIIKLRDPALPAVPVIHPCFPLGVNDVAPTQQLTISPNPVTDILTIQGAQPAGITITNTLGRQVLSATHTNTLNIKWLSTGIYFIRLHDEHGHLLYTGKVVKE